MTVGCPVCRGVIAYHVEAFTNERGHVTHMGSFCLLCKGAHVVHPTVASAFNLAEGGPAGIDAAKAARKHAPRLPKSVRKHARKSKRDDRNMQMWIHHQRMNARARKQQGFEHLRQQLQELKKSANQWKVPIVTAQQHVVQGNARAQAAQIHGVGADLIVVDAVHHIRAADVPDGVKLRMYMHKARRR